MEVLRRLRARGATVPVLILTANASVAGRVAGLDSGADDYLAKPFDLSELEARIRAQLRRAGNQKNPLVELGSLSFDSNSRQFALRGDALTLTPRERAVLEMLLQRAGKPVAKSVLAQSVFGFEDEANPNAIEIYVHRVRKKLEGSDVGIATLRGLGYVLRKQNGG
jgi:two-component system response regulator TctD